MSETPTPPDHAVTITLTTTDPSALRELGILSLLYGAPADTLVLPPSYTVDSVSVDPPPGPSGIRTGEGPEHGPDHCVPRWQFDSWAQYGAGLLAAHHADDKARLALAQENRLLRTVAVDMSQLRIRRSAEDGEFVATTGTHPSLSSKDPDPDRAVHRLFWMITEFEQEREGRLELSEYCIGVDEDGDPELRHRPHQPGPDEPSNGHRVDAAILGATTDLTDIVDAIYRHHREHHPLPTPDGAEEAT